MKTKALIIAIFTVILSLFFVSYSFANNTAIDNVANGIRNFVGGTENVIENAGSAIGNTVQGGMNAVSNGARNVGNATENTVGTMTDNNDNDNYDARRTATGMNTNNGTGIDTRTYTWVIIGVTAVAIGFLLWSYFRQNSNNNIYIDSNDR